MGATCCKGRSDNDVGGADTLRNPKYTPTETDTLLRSETASASETDDDTELDELHRVTPVELGNFVVKKMNNKTLDRLWRHLDEDGSGEIERDEVLNILQWMAVLYVAFRFKQQGGQGQPTINKKKLKRQFVPVKDWIVNNKMQTKRVVKRDEFRKLFGAWLKEYSSTQTQQ
mmetsp:Transcript_31439/g.50925  ORF Transcript_31439/g.50925 Transcript_31439/m.50925 type:complete len:172 (-) Transcript_31439:352-867(-)|eukprot:CAMPEP_0202712586 /NCGR_PEP_ID=MMETSP1385-20130828/43524_1 /ASSEMBLY_ACC=CAM_ASM_000861 /TAXON_ID=933848 /ORGANISM="Elphidium margaritaceum" /LENGTH=171 /DNA_ID=CAMNT_0049372673 /DNA_START=102 /DNA_END=617 /DNA_ORIENTATION=+